MQKLRKVTFAPISGTGGNRIHPPGLQGQVASLEHAAPELKLTLLISTRLIDFQLAHTGFEPVTSGFPTACSTAEQNALSVLVDTDGDRTHELRSAGAVPFLLGYWPMIFSSAVGTRTRISDLKGR